MNLSVNVTAEWVHKLSLIRIMAIDVDGVLTDSGMYYTSSGETMKKFSARDGKAIELLQVCGIRPVFITGENNDIILRRAEKLSVREVHMGIKDKVAVAGRLLGKYALGWENVLAVGDDWQDVPLLRAGGFSCCPADALPEIQRQVQYVCRRRGGEGVIGEILALCAAARPEIAAVLEKA
ncbi:MAG: HAD family hydrolase [Candidatus Omnitrophica bacterium]|nr:HAD family hydrolase [Candidatus Omnitrophota bacterium]